MRNILNTEKINIRTILFFFLKMNISQAEALESI